MVLRPMRDTSRGFYSNHRRSARTTSTSTYSSCRSTSQRGNVHFTFGHRVGANKRWVGNRPGFEVALGLEMQKEIPFLTELKTAKDIAKALELRTKPNEKGYVNPHCIGALAYAHVRAGNIRAAERTFDSLLKCVNPAIACEEEIASRARLFRNKLLDSHENAREQHAAWEAETTRDLKLEPFRTGLLAARRHISCRGSKF
jgi:hypothetical protein